MATRKKKTATGRKEHPKKRLAKLMVIDQGYDLKTAAELCDINVNTLSGWNKKEDWLIQQAARKSGPDKLVFRTYEQMQKIYDLADSEGRALTDGESDRIVKLSATINRLDKTASESIIMSVFKNFNNWLVMIDPDLAKATIDHQLNYVQGLIEAKK